MHVDSSTAGTATSRITPISVVIVTLDGHLSSTCERAEHKLQESLPGLSLTMHSATDWDKHPETLQACNRSIVGADIVITTMLFLEAQIQAVLPALQARAKDCDAMIGCMCGSEIMRLTRMGSFTMDGSSKGPMSLLKKLRRPRSSENRGASQLKMLRRLPKILKYMPGSAQDLRAYFLTLQCWLAGSEDNMVTMVQLLVQRYASGPRECLRALVNAPEPIEYPDNGLYHPDLQHRVTTCLDTLPTAATATEPVTGARIGLLLMRSYVLAGNTKHYDRLIQVFEERGLSVVPAFASGLDARPVIDEFFTDEQGRATIDCLVSLTGFSLVGGPAYNDSAAAVEALGTLDVPYLAAHPSEFQSLQDWSDNAGGLTPIEATMMISIPEIDGATNPILFAGHDGSGAKGNKDMRPVEDRLQRLIGRVEQLVRLRHTQRHERKLGIVLFNFPPNAGSTGTAAFLDVMQSLHNTLQRLSCEGYDVEVPESVEALREALLVGNAERFGTDANVLQVVDTDTHVRSTPWLEELEAGWGPAPGKHLANGRGIFILGRQFGKVTVGVQPGFGVEGDPMRLLFEGGFAPTHAFSAFYRYLQHTVGVNALLHFGTHGALEFMPGKQVGLSGRCWPDRLIGDTPNLYFYAANNPSEGALAKRRSAATLISYMTPSVTQAGLYRGLQDLKGTLDQWLNQEHNDSQEARTLLALIQQQSGELELDEGIDWDRGLAQGDVASIIARLKANLLDYEYTLIPHGLHVIGKPLSLDQRVDQLHAWLEMSEHVTPEPQAIRAVLEDEATDAGSRTAEIPTWVQEVRGIDADMRTDGELSALIRLLDGRFLKPAPGGDVLRNRETLPTGRNLHGFDPFRMPTAQACTAGARHAELLLQRHCKDHGKAPESIAFVLWGTDNLKNEGVPIAQVLALMGVAPRFDAYGRLSGASLIPLESLGRPRVDVIVTLSGIFRDLLPLQTRLLAEAALMASEADEPLEMNAIRRHTLAYQAEHGCDLETAALRVYSNANGAYGANVNQLIDSGMWSDEKELASTYTERKCFAYGVKGDPVKQDRLLKSSLADVDLAYQNLESVELGVTSIDYYFDTLGGINSLVKQARGKAAPVYIGDQTRGQGTVRSLNEQVALETRTRMLNPKWYEGMLEHGYEGVHQIEQGITNTLGWSATTGQVSSWVYNQLAHTFMLDPAMRERLAALNPAASARLANRLIEANEREYWSPSDEVLQALQDAGDEIEDQLEGVKTGAAA